MLAIGHTLRNRYHIQRLLGQGGMGAVYLAQDMQRPGHWIAVKEMVPVPNTSPRALAQARDQFRREAQVLMALRHHNLPQVYEYFSEAGNEYLVMQYVEGRNLQEIAAADWGQGRILGEGRVLGWAIQIMDALEYLHSQRPYPVLHRDIKPQNVILTPGGELYLVDFGLVKLLDPTNPQTVTALRGMGTPEYAPPEQYATGGTHTGPYSDVYALGATLYYLLTGQAPATATERLLPASLAKPLVPPRQLNPAISPAMEQALVKALELEPADRFASAGEMRRALMGQVSPPRRFPVRLAAGAGLVLLVIVAVLILFAGQRPDDVAAVPTATSTLAPTSMPTDTPIPSSPTYTPDVLATQTVAAALVAGSISSTQTAEAKRWTVTPTTSTLVPITPTHTPVPVAATVAPSPAPTKPASQTVSLLPAPTLLWPEDGWTVEDPNVSIILKWNPLKPSLAADELYLISLVYQHYGQTWTDYAWTRQAEWSVLEHKYLIDLSDNGRFAWCVTLIRQTSTRPDGVPDGIALSEPCTERTFVWRRPGRGGDDEGDGDGGYPSSP